MKSNIKQTAFILTVVFAIILFSGVSDLWAKGLPDLQIIKVYAGKDCKLTVTVRNNGPGLLPDYVYSKHHPKSAGVFVYINGNKWGGESIWKFDTHKKLKRPGGVAVCQLNYAVSTPISVKALVDMWNDVKEANERNNSVTVKASCRGSSGPQIKRMPDLIVKDIKLVKGCQILVTVKNIGPLGVPDSYYNLPNAVGVQMYKNGSPWGGIILSGFDPNGKLKSPGGEASHVWFPQATNLKLGPGIHSIKVEVDNNKVLAEMNENNNTLTRRLDCKATFATMPATTAHLATTPVLTAKAPQRFFVDFKDAYLAYKKSTKSIQVIAESNVISYGSDWEKCQLKPFLFHIRQKVWQGFYWKVNTSRKEVYKVTGGTFCQLGGSETKINAVVQDAADFFYLRFPTAYLVYVPATKTVQVATSNTVLSYTQDWEKCNLSNVVYQLKEKFWSGFHWEINTLQKKAWRVKSSPFCQAGGTKETLKASVRVVN